MHYGAASAIEVAVLSDKTCFQEFSGSSLVPDYLFFSWQRFGEFKLAKHSAVDSNSNETPRQMFTWAI